jgi:hypothetical protein
MGKLGSPLAMSTEFAALSVSLDWLPKGIGSGFKGGAPERSDAAKVNIGHDSDRRAADRSRYDGRDLLRLQLRRAGKGKRLDEIGTAWIGTRLIRFFSRIFATSEREVSSLAEMTLSDISSAPRRPCDFA